MQAGLGVAMPKRRTRLWIALCLAPLAAQPAAALAQATGPETVLHLGATGSVEVAPDQIMADMTVQNTASGAAAAQRRVNDLMAGAVRTAQGVAGVEARAVGYSVSPADEKRTSWTARQTLELRGSDGPALLDLAGRLQEEGLAVASLEWRLSPALWRKAHDQATTAALKDLQARAASAAATLGLRVDHLQEVRLDASALLGRPSMPIGALALAARVAPPQVGASPQEVTAEASADVLLRP